MTLSSTIRPHRLLIRADGHCGIFLTEDLTADMIMTDKWTWLMVVIAVIQIIVMIITKNKKEEAEENAEEGTQEQ